MMRRMIRTAILWALHDPDEEARARARLEAWRRAFRLPADRFPAH